jgi:hypothetical protein
MQKLLVFDPIQTSPFGGPSTSGRPQIKKLLGQKVLRI